MSIRGKRAIITGSARGIGLSVARALAAAGASVVVNSRDATAVAGAVQEIKDAGGTALAAAGPVDDPAFVTEIVERCVKAFGGVDILINNAAVFDGGTIGPILGCSIDSWRKTMAVNLDGVFFGCRAVLPHMIAQRWGRIINTASFAGTGKMGGSAYSTSKSALFGLTRAIAADYGPYGITANAFNPEALTAMGAANDVEAYRAFLHHVEKRGFRSAAETAYSYDTSGPDAIAPWVTYLCTDEAEYLNGQAFAVESRRIGLIAAPEEERVLFRDHAGHGVWKLEELSRMAPLVFRVSNRWPRRTEEDLRIWEQV